MDGLLILSGFIVFFWLISLQISLGEKKRKFADLADAFEALKDRLLKLEREASPPQHIRPVPQVMKQAEVVAPPPPPPPIAEAPKVQSADVLTAQTHVASRTSYVVPAQRPAAARLETPVASIPVQQRRAEPVMETKMPEPSRHVSIEERLGQNWLNKLGIVTLVIGLALFLGYQMQNLGPLGKSLIGLTLSLTLLLGGLVLEKRDRYRVFARAGIGGGWALTFFVTFAMYHLEALRVLPSQGLDLVLMLLVATGMVWHSLRYKSQVVTSLAFLLAFVTVGISHVTLFSLVAGVLLACGLVYVAARERWYELGLAGLLGVYCNHFLWLQRVLPQGGQVGKTFPEFFASAALLLTYWLLFRMFYIFRVPQGKRQQTIATLGAIVNSVGLLSLLKYQSSHPEWAFAGLLVLGSAEMVLAFLARRQWRTAFLVLASIASALLVAAIPFRFSGSNWTLLWLLEGEMLFVAGIAIRERLFRRFGIGTHVLALLQTLAFAVQPIFDLRQSGVDPSRHPSVAISLWTAAALFWFNAEFAPRCWPELLSDAIDTASLRIVSCLGVIAMAVGLWVFVPGCWTVLLWLGVALALAFTANRLVSADLATQADTLALAAFVRAAIVNLPQTNTPLLWGHIAARTLSVAVASALLYVGMRRKTRSHLLPEQAIAAAYTWLASSLLGALLFVALPEMRIVLGWGALGLVLFEAGAIFHKGYLRHQAYALFALSLMRMLFINLLAGTPHQHGTRVYTVVPLIAVYLWVYERTRTRFAEFEIDRWAGTFFAWAGVVAASGLIERKLSPSLIVIGWSVLAFVLLMAASLLKRKTLEAQSLVVLAAVTVRALIYNFALLSSAAAPHWESKTYTVAATCGILLLCLPWAFRIRRFGEAVRLYAEQAFFFVPFALGTLLLAIELRFGLITVGWSALGVATFLFALLVGERSYRLAGLGLLMAGLGKIVLIDIWSAPPIDRYLTLIVTGVALLLVSFLYSRYKETILKLL